MKNIKIKFSGMGGRFDPENNFIVNILKKHFEIQLSDEPDYLIYSVNSKDYLDYNCVRIFYTAENLVPDFNICDYGIGFHYLTFEDRYIRFPVYLVDGFTAYDGDDYASDLSRAAYKHENVEKSLEGKSTFCSFVYSNGEAAKCREKVFEALSEYKTVSSGGRYKNNVGGPIESKLDFQRKCKFVIAFENSEGKGYTTEKIVHAFSAGAVPIYWGNPDITKEFNPDSFINCYDLGLSSDAEKSAIDQIVERVKYLDSHDEAYEKMLRAPAFKDPQYVETMQSEFEAFLFNIFDQPIEKAYRRNRYYWGRRYEYKQKIGNSFYWTLRKAIPIRDKLRKFIKK